MDANSLNGYQLKTSYWLGEDQSQPNRVRGIYVNAYKDGEEVGSLTFDRDDEAGTGPHFNWPGIEVHPEHRGRGLASAMVNRMSRLHPNATFRWHEFASQEGLRVAQRANRANPSQHLLDEGDAVVQADKYPTPPG